MQWGTPHCLMKSTCHFAKPLSKRVPLCITFLLLAQLTSVLLKSNLKRHLNEKMGLTVIIGGTYFKWYY